MPKKEGVPLDVLQAHFHLPLVEVAAKFGHSVSFMKKICRGYGIKRWPCRQVNSVKRQLASMVEKHVALRDKEVERKAKVDALQEDWDQLHAQGQILAPTAGAGDAGDVDRFQTLLRMAQCVLQQDALEGNEGGQELTENADQEDMVPTSMGAMGMQIPSQSLGPGPANPPKAPAMVQPKLMVNPGLPMPFQPGPPPTQQELTLQELTHMQQRMDWLMMNGGAPMMGPESSQAVKQNPYAHLAPDDQVKMMAKDLMMLSGLGDGMGPGFTDHVPQAAQFTDTNPPPYTADPLAFVPQPQQPIRPSSVPTLPLLMPREVRPGTPGTQMLASQSAQIIQQINAAYAASQMMGPPARVSKRAPDNRHKRVMRQRHPALPPLESNLHAVMAMTQSSPNMQPSPPPGSRSQGPRPASRPLSASMNPKPPVQPQAPPGAPTSPKRAAAEDKFCLRKVPMNDGSVRGWYEAQPDELINIAHLAAVAEWWEVQEVRGYQLRPRQLGVLKDRGVVVVNGNKFKWYRPSALFDAVYQDSSQENMLTLEYKAGAGQGFVAKDRFSSQMILSSVDQCRRLRTRLSEILIQQLAGQDFVRAEINAGEVQLQDIQQMIKVNKADKESPLVDTRPNMIHAGNGDGIIDLPSSQLQPTPPPEDGRQKRARPPSACSVDSCDNSDEAEAEMHQMSLECPF